MNENKSYCEIMNCNQPANWQSIEVDNNRFILCSKHLKSAKKMLKLFVGGFFD